MLTITQVKARYNREAPLSMGFQEYLQLYFVPVYDAELTFLGYQYDPV